MLRWHTLYPHFSTTFFAHHPNSFLHNFQQPYSHSVSIITQPPSHCISLPSYPFTNHSSLRLRPYPHIDYPQLSPVSLLASFRLAKLTSPQASPQRVRSSLQTIHPSSTFHLHFRHHSQSLTHLPSPNPRHSVSFAIVVSSPPQPSPSQICSHVTY